MNHLIVAFILFVNYIPLFIRISFVDSMHFCQANQKSLSKVSSLKILRFGLWQSKGPPKHPLTSNSITKLFSLKIDIDQKIVSSCLLFWFISSCFTAGYWQLLIEKPFQFPSVCVCLSVPVNVVRPRMWRNPIYTHCGVSSYSCSGSNTATPGTSGCISVYLLNSTTWRK